MKDWIKNPTVTLIVGFILGCSSHAGQTAIAAVRALIGGG